MNSNLMSRSRAIAPHPAPSLHATPPCFAVSATATIDQLHVSDSNGGNNGGSDEGTVEVTEPDFADVKVTGLTVDAPDEQGANEPFEVTVVATLHNNGPTSPVNVSYSITLNAPNDCSVREADPGARANGFGNVMASYSIL